MSKMSAEKMKILEEIVLSRNTSAHVLHVITNKISEEKQISRIPLFIARHANTQSEDLNTISDNWNIYVPISIIERKDAPEELLIKFCSSQHNVIKDAAFTKTKDLLQFKNWPEEWVAAHVGYK